MKPTDEQIRSVLLSVLTDAFNRSLGELENAGAIDTRKLRANYRPGSPFYEAVTRGMEATIGSATARIRALFET